MQAGMLWNWETFPHWLDTLARIPKGVNCLSYAPLAPLMTYVMGLENAKRRAATPDEMSRMLRARAEAAPARRRLTRLRSHARAGSPPRRPPRPASPGRPRSW
jgi:hypothetical protein